MGLGAEEPPGEHIRVEEGEVFERFAGADEAQARGSSRRRATTLPPFAVPSSFVMTRPVRGNPAANRLPCATRFCPVVPSRTSSVSWGASGDP